MEFQAPGMLAGQVASIRSTSTRLLGGDLIIIIIVIT
jgi:hypothetical protein